MQQRSETSLCRKRLSKYCTGVGLDIGYGGDPIVESAITVDLIPSKMKPHIYPQAAQNIYGDARFLHWFSSNFLDYVYSSHMLEDLPHYHQVLALKEWERVLKVGGLIILYLPDEKLYRAHCDKAGKPRNSNHKNEDFSLVWFIEKLLSEINNVEIVHSNPHCEKYSFEIVMKKVENKNDK